MATITNSKMMWVVTRAARDSTLADVCFTASPKDLMLQVRGGLEVDEVVAVFDNEHEAKDLATYLIKNAIQVGKHLDAIERNIAKSKKAMEDKLLARDRRRS
jgi:superfamily I DNA and RNA helicase